jgi:hypothetical protein
MFMPSWYLMNLKEKTGIVQSEQMLHVAFSSSYIPGEGNVFGLFQRGWQIDANVGNMKVEL